MSLAVAKAVFFLVLIFLIILSFVSARPLINGGNGPPVGATWVRHWQAPVPSSSHSSCTHMPLTGDGGRCSTPPSTL